VLLSGRFVICEQHRNYSELQKIVGLLVLFDKRDYNFWIPEL